MQPVTVTTKHLLTIMPGSIIPKTLEIGVWNELNKSFSKTSLFKTGNQTPK
jgi:hypothetical protein